MARTPKPAHEAAAILSRRVLVNIQRDQTAVTPRVVWQHEIPILEGIFGEGSVKELPPETLDEGYSGKPSADMLAHNKTQDMVRRPSESLGLGFAFIGDARGEYDRLVAAFGAHPEVKMSWCEHIYGRFQSGTFSKVLGKPEPEDLPAEQLRQLVLAYGYDLPTVTYESSEADRKAAAAAAAEFWKMPREKLVAIAEEVGVELG